MRATGVVDSVEVDGPEREVAAEAPTEHTTAHSAATEKVVYKVGDRVRIRDREVDRWILGNVTSVAPLLVRPNRWTTSMSFRFVSFAPEAIYLAGDRVRVRDREVDAWLLGNVTRAEPLLVRPDGWPTSMSFKFVSSPLEDQDSIETWSMIGNAITSVAGIGALDTGYLTLVKLGQTPLMCPATEGACNKVLSSPYASVGPVPLAVIGFAGYVAVMGLTLGTGTSWRKKQELQWLTLAMALTSAGLVGVLLGVLKIPCVFCGVSAFATAVLLALVEAGRSKEATMEAQEAVYAQPVATRRQLREAQRPARRQVLAFSALVAAGAVGAATLRASSPAADGWMALTNQYKPEHPPVLSSSTAAEIALAKHLAARGAKVYTAWWCPHCQDQRENFGSKAAKFAPFVECSNLEYRQLPICKEADITGYPTWIIDGTKYSGARDLAELANLTDFTAFPKETFRKRTDEELAYIWGLPEEEGEEEYNATNVPGI